MVLTKPENTQGGAADEVEMHPSAAKAGPYFG
jgi:hypothetical protein